MAMRDFWTKQSRYKFQRIINYSKVTVKYNVDHKYRDVIPNRKGAFTFSDANNEITVDATELRDFINSIKFK